MDEFKTAAQKFQDLPEKPALDPKWKLFWLIFIGIAELPLNGLVFSIFGASRVETYIMAATMCFAIPMAAHFMGQSLRQKIKSNIDIWFLFLVPIFILGLLAVIAFLRAKFFEAVDTQELVGITLKPQQATILFIIINVALFLVAVIISYEGSHPDQKLYNALYKRLKQSLKILKKEAKEEKKAAEELEKAELGYQRERQIRLKSHEKLIKELNNIKETVDWLVATYRAANMSVRNDVPECFKNSPAIVAIPDN
jgi:signal transduction histidine kinase